MARPSERDTGAVAALIDEWVDRMKAESPWGRGPTQGDLAKAVGVNERTLSGWKHCRSRLQMDEMLALERETGVPLASWVEAVQADLPTVQVHLAERSGRTRRGRQEQPGD